MSNSKSQNIPFNSDAQSPNPLTHCCSYRVIYGDTDNMGMAYHANYLRWMEIGRTELFRAWGVSYKTMEEKGIMLPVSEVSCKYVTPARYDTLMTIETTLDERIRGGLKFDYCIFDRENGNLLAHGHTKHACVNPDGKVVRPPQFVVEMIKQRLADAPL